MRRRLNYANVTATLALFFAMSGGALAAKHYLINSTKQINPKVLRALKGNVGPRGPQGISGKEGAPGKEGAAGKDGKTGEPGPLVGTLPTGKSLTGAFGGGSSGPKFASIEASISYAFPLAKSPELEVVQEGGLPTVHCPGNSEAPTAKPGYLCVYVTGQNGEVGAVKGFGAADGNKNFQWGAVLFAEILGGCATTCFGEMFGTWAVTAQ